MAEQQRPPISRVAPWVNLPLADGSVVPAGQTAPQATVTPLGATAGAEAMDDTTYNSILQRLNEANLRSRADQEKGVQGLEEQLKKYRARAPELDLSAAMGLNDSLFGTNLRQGYKRPETQAELDAAATALQQGIQQERRGLTQADLELFKNQANIAGNLEASKLRQENAATVRADAAKEKSAKEAKEAEAKAKEDADKKARQLEEDTQKLAKELGAAPANIKTNISKLDQMISALPNPEEIPGVGPGQRFTPEFMKSPEGQSIGQLAYDLTADLIKLQSGTAASESEVRRKMVTLGLGDTQDDSQFVSGLNNLQDKLKEALASQSAGFAPEVVENYGKRGGVTAKTFGSYSFGRKPKAAPTAPAATKPVEEMTDEEVREAWKKKNGVK